MMDIKETRNDQAQNHKTQIQQQNGLPFSLSELLLHSKPFLIIHSPS